MNMQMRPDRQVISAVEVAALLGYRCRESFSRTRRETLEAAGFPRKLPGLNGWSKPAIMRWLESNGELASNDDKPAGKTPLERRFG
ncbi:hypothetical protein MCHK_3027 [Mesorhizobium huakuii 7653R]|nr:hypothetical protein MCHK_3027 [Mesorhizobium huakuii 7653R]